MDIATLFSQPNPPLWLIVIAVLGAACLVSGVLWLHVILSARRPLWLGAIVPVLFVIGCGLLSLGNPGEFSFGLGVGYVVTLLILLVIWFARQRRRPTTKGEPPTALRS